MRITSNFSFRATGQRKLPFSETEKTERSKSEGKDENSQLDKLSLRCLLDVQVEIENSIYRSAGQERDYGRATRTKTKSRVTRLPVKQGEEIR